MPELPEVETVRRSLLPLVKNKKITAISTNWEKILINGLTAFQNRSWALPSPRLIAAVSIY